MLRALREHWPEYLMEAAGLAFFMINAAILATLLDNPESPVHEAIPGDLLRRIPLGIMMGFVIVAIVYSSWGKRTGAHINPAVTLTFLRLGRIAPIDAAMYIVFQFLGGIAAAQLMKFVLGAPFADPSVNFATTHPGPAGPGAAFAAELGITFLLVLAVLFFMGAKRLEKYTGWLCGALIMLYLFFETPLSGMSMNPARSFGSAVAAGIYEHLWIYFVAPPVGALLAGEVFARLRKDSRACAKIHHDSALACIFCDYRKQSIPHFPVENPA